MSIEGAAAQPPEGVSDDASGAGRSFQVKPATGYPLGSQDQSRGAPANAPCGDSERAGGADTQVIFDERFALFMDQFGATCDHERVPVAVAIVCDPKITQGPLVMTRGHKYDIACVLAQLLRRIKGEMGRELDA